MVGLGRVELPTSRLSGVRSNHLSYRPEPKLVTIVTAEAVPTLKRMSVQKEKRGRRVPHMPMTKATSVCS